MFVALLLFRCLNLSLTGAAYASVPSCEELLLQKGGYFENQRLEVVEADDANEASAPIERRPNEEIVIQGRIPDHVAAEKVVVLADADETQDEFLAAFAYADRALLFFENLGYPQEKVRVCITRRLSWPLACAHEDAVELKHNKDSPLESPARDSTVLAHEISHVVIGRVSGGSRRFGGYVKRSKVDKLAHGMEEGLADYFAVAITGENRIAGRYLKDFPARIRDIGKRPENIELSKPHSLGHLFAYELLKHRNGIAGARERTRFDAAVLQASDIFGNDDLSFSSFIDVLAAKLGVSLESIKAHFSGTCEIDAL